MMMHQNIIKNVTIGIIAFAPLVVFAQSLTKPKDFVKGLIGIVNDIVTVLFILAIAVFAWGIIKMISAAGDPKAVQEAKGIIYWGVIGMFILASMYGIVVYLREVFGVGDNTLMINVPKFNQA